MPISEKLTRMPSEVVICIDRIEKGRLIFGRVYNRYSKKASRFTDVVSLFEILEKLMNSISFPGQTVRYRTFKKTASEVTELEIAKKKVWSHKELFKQNGEERTLFLSIISRNNSTWQGEVYFLEGDLNYQFKSEIELMDFIYTI